MISRREVLIGMAAAPLAAAPAPLKVCVFSKHFQWTDIKETASIAAQLGFDGVDLTVRKGGHVLPERVAEDLPKAAETIRKAGSHLMMITADIVDATTPHAEAIVKAMKGIGLRDYRWGGFRLVDNKPIPAQLEVCKSKSRDLAALNKQYGVCAMYHTHSGLNQIGAAIWDLWYFLKDLDTNHVGVNYDVGHATVEGGYGGWINTANLTAPMMRGVALKDFIWGKGPKGNWLPQWCAAGQGMVNYPKFFSMLKTNGFQGPVQVHYEYPELGEAHAGRTTLDIPKEKFLAILKRDLDYVRAGMKTAGI
jgi:sugar phosphate isomerase/epimerase